MVDLPPFFNNRSSPLPETAGTYDYQGGPAFLVLLTIRVREIKTRIDVIDLTFTNIAFFIHDFHLLSWCSEYFDLSTHTIYYTAVILATFLNHLS